MARRISRKELKRDEFVEATVDATHWIERHWSEVVKWTAVALVVAVVVLAWTAWSRSKLKAIEAELAVAIDRYQQIEADGFSDTAGLETVLSSFAKVGDSSASAAAAARFYEGTSLFRLKRLDDAAGVLESVVDDNSASVTLRAAARTLLIDVWRRSGATEKATAALSDLIEQDDPLLPPSLAMLKLAEIQAEAGNDTVARATLQRIVDEHTASPEAQEARDQLGL